MHLTASGLRQAMPVRLIEERKYDPLRSVLVDHDGRWWPPISRPAA